MKRIATLFVLLGIVGMTHASDFTDVGYTSEPGTVYGNGRDCSVYQFVYDHDYSFENGLMYWYSGVEEPYVGSFGMAYETAIAGVACVALWLTDVYYYAGQTCDIYVWEGGISGPPSGVLYMEPGFDPGQPAIWPDVSQHDADINDFDVLGEVTVGYWGNWPGQAGGWYCAMDTNGFGGHPWVYTSGGWSSSSGYGEVAWGIGYYELEHPSPTESATWGAIKALFD